MHPKSLHYSTLTLLRIPTLKFSDKKKMNCMLTITLSTYKISFCGRKRRGLKEICGEAREENVSKQESNTEGKTELR
jgi:hypothetical protein